MLGCPALANGPSFGRAGGQAGGQPSRLTPGWPPAPALNLTRSRLRLPPRHRPGLTNPIPHVQRISRAAATAQLERFCRRIVAKKPSVSPSPEDADVGWRPGPRKPLALA